MRKIILFLLIVGIAGYFYLKDSNPELLKVGYLPHDIKIIEENLTTEEIEYLLTHGKLNYITNVIKHQKYDSVNLEKYINLKNKYPHWEVEQVITIGNSDIEENIADELIQNNSFKIDKLDRYLDYYKTNSEADIESVILIVNEDIDLKTSTYSPIIKDLIKEQYFISDKFERYLNFYTKNKNRTTNEIIAMVNSYVDYGFYEHNIVTDISMDNLMLVNKFYQLPSNYVPSDLVTIESKYGHNGQLRKETYEEFKKMYHEAEKENLRLNIASPYRSYSLQKSVYENYVARDGQRAADTYSARPGHSEHQTGLTIDIGVINDSFKNTNEFKWLQDNAYKYGFILRYPEGLSHITGYKFEPWHYRYVGVEVATEVHNLGITFDEYYAFFLE